VTVPYLLCTYSVTVASLISIYTHQLLSDYFLVKLRQKAEQHYTLGWGVSLVVICFFGTFQLGHVIQMQTLSSYQLFSTCSLPSFFG